MDAKKFMKKGYLCYIDGELFDKPDVFDDMSYFKMEIKPKSSARKSIKESNLPNKVYDVLNELASNFLLDYDEFVEFERNGLEHHFDKIRELGTKLKKADMKGDYDLYKKIADEIVTVVKRANGTLDESKKNVRKAMKEQFVGKGEGGYRKPDKTKFNSGVCLDSNGVKHTVIFDTHVEDFIVWVDDDNYLMWYVSSPQSLLNNLSESDLDENLILDIVALWEKLPKKHIKKN